MTPATVTDPEGSAEGVGVYVFDVGETLIDEIRVWGRHADRLGLSHLTFFALLGAVIADARHHHDLVADLGVDAWAFLAAIDAEENPADGILPVDLYPDVVPTLQALAAAGHRLGIAPHAPSGRSRRWSCPRRSWPRQPARGVAKPSAEFFDRLVALAGVAGRGASCTPERLQPSAPTA